MKAANSAIRPSRWSVVLRVEYTLEARVASEKEAQAAALKYWRGGGVLPKPDVIEAMAFKVD
jgi:hypothetical protein